MTDRNTQLIALFDLDGTLCNYDEALNRDMEKLRSPKEKPFRSYMRDKEPDYIRARMDLIRGNPEWWDNLNPLPIGFRIYHLLLDWYFRIVVLTQGPKRNAEAWKGKLLWCRHNLHPETDVVITRDKSLVYGKILVDDFPPYVTAWLRHRPRGTVIMPDQPWNKGFKHPQVIRYRGTSEDDLIVNENISYIVNAFNGESEE